MIQIMRDINKKENDLNFFGEFSDIKSETEYREAAWEGLTDRIGKTSLIAGIFFLLAGAAPFFIKTNYLAHHLLFFRTLTALWGIFIYFSSSWKRMKNFLLTNIAVFIILMGVFESCEAVLTYRPEFEYNIPFTLIIILLSYLLFPLSVKAVASASVFSSAVYISSLGLFTPAEWTDLIQISVFFIFTNLTGLYIFVDLSKNRRYRYLSYNEINKLYFLLNEEIKKKDEANRKLSLLAETDSLTGIANRRKFFSKLENEFSKSLRYKRPLSLLMLDIDHFKEVNDSFGHDAGDQVLKEYIERCKSKLRQSDIIARIGGEEFCVILPETTEEGACSLAERIREGIEENRFKIDNADLEITSSCGIASVSSADFNDISEFVKAADNALYKAKESGRNKNCIYRMEKINENN